MARPKFSHTAIYGATQTGKSTRMRRLSQHSRRRMIIYDPTAAKVGGIDGWRDSLGGWLDDRKTHFCDSPYELVHCAYKHRDADIFVDEAADCLSMRDPERWWLATKSRHLGHQLHFASQRPRMVAPSVRAQANILYIYRLGREDMRAVLSDIGIGIKNTDRIPHEAGEYFYIDLFSPRLMLRRENIHGEILHEEVL